MSLRWTAILALLAVTVTSCAPSDEGLPETPARPSASAVAPAASSIPPRFETFQMTDGLVSNEANTFLQDRQGFLWIGTFNGLSRFDGARFRNFLHDPADSTSLGHNAVNWLHQDQTGAIWVGTNDGLDRFDPETETFSHYRHDPEDPTSLSHPVVRTVVEGADGTIWAGTNGGGLNHLDPATGTFQRIGQPLNGAPENGTPGWDVVHALLPNEDGTLWVGGTSGLALYAPETDALSPVRKDPGDPSAASLPTVTCLVRDQRGRIWAGTGSDGAYRVGPAGSSIRHYPHDPARPDGLGDPWVLSLTEDRSGTIWLGTNGGGLHRFDPESDAFVRYTYDASDPQSLRDDDVLALLQTRDGVLWVGTYAGLARRYPLSTTFRHVRARPDDARGLRSNTVTSFAEEADGTLWVGTDGGGLQQRDAPSDVKFADVEFTHVPYELATPRSRAATDILSLALDDAGALWVGAIGGLYRRDPSSARFTRITPEDSPAAWPVVFAMHVADGHVLGATGHTGVYDIETATGRLRRAQTTPTEAVMAVLRDRTGDVWAGTYNAGLWRVAVAPDGSEALVPVSVSASAQHVTTFHEDRDGAIWVGTADGLDQLILHETDTTVTRFRYAEGLPNTSIRGIEEDVQGRLWIGTAAGLSWRDPQTGRFVSYDAQDGIESGGPLYRSPHTGRMYVGGDYGYSVFDPATVSPEPPPPAPVLTELRVRGESMQIGTEDAPLQRALSMTEDLRLHYDDRVVSLAFASLDYQAPGTHRYAVRLDGFDDDWRDLGNQRAATFTNLSPGSYTFRVRAAGRSGVWGDETALTVRVVPPWWRTWWALVGYALVALGLATALVRDRRRRTRLRRQLEIEHVEAEQLRQLDRAKSAFFANVSHEFRTPLTLTLGPLDDVISGEYGPLPDEAATQLSLARRSAGRVLGLINQILDVSRLEAGSTPLHARQLDLSAFARAQVDAFAPWASHRKVAVSVVAPEATVRVWADPEHLGTILSNLLSNAFKFTPEGGTVRVAIAEDGERASLTVRDTGPGIEASDLPHIFDRFYQAVGPANQPLGSGIGLALAFELAALHSGTLTAVSDVGKGSTFTLALPLGHDHLARHQLVDAPWDGEPVPTPAVETATPEESGVELAPTDPGAIIEDVTTVLVVDDNNDIRTYLRRHLETAGYRVLEADDGEDALDRIREQLPDLVVSDVMMPRLDGLGLCRAIRSSPETDFIPVLLLTAKAAPEDQLEGLAELCDDYLTKPFDVRQLVARVDTLIAIRKRLRLRFGGDGADPTQDHRQPVSADDAFIAAVRAAIDAHLSDDTFGVAALAEAVGQSRSHLLRRTTALMGASPSELIRTARLDRAAELLAAQAGTVSEVAYGVGFKSVAHFSNAFLAHTGVRPSAYAETAS
ncbi:MAG: hybrid sensor histidine kinase/response regulator transcription factor [Rubricoccaceae bacterium]